MAYTTDEEKTEQEETKTAEKELKTAKEKLAYAESRLTELENRVEILNEKKKQSRSFAGKSEDNLKDKKYSDASVYAKEAFKQADEIISDIRGYNYMVWYALGLEIFFIIVSFAGIYYLFNTPMWSQKVNALGIPFWAFLAGFLGAVAYAAHGVAYHYYKGDFGLDDILYYFKGLVQGALLAAPVYLILSNLTGTEQLVLDVNNFTAVAGNVTAQTWTIPVSTAQSNVQVLGAACFLTGLFTRHVVEFLYFVANRLFQITERGKKQ